MGFSAFGECMANKPSFSFTVAGSENAPLFFVTLADFSVIENAWEELLLRGMQKMCKSRYPIICLIYIQMWWGFFRFKAFYVSRGQPHNQLNIPNILDYACVF